MIFGKSKTTFKIHCKTSADKLFSKFYKDIELLESFPFSFPLVRDPYLSSLGYRMIPVDNFLVFYVVKDKEVQVHRFIYGKRNYLNLLK